MVKFNTKAFMYLEQLISVETKDDHLPTDKRDRNFHFACFICLFFNKSACEITKKDVWVENIHNL